MSVPGKLKIMVASTVHGFEDQIERICAVLDQYGYDVLNSHLGTIRSDPMATNRADCLRAVDECSVFFGIIRPYYGSGVVGGTSIVHEEMKKALQSDKPRWVMVDDRLEFLRQIMRKNAFQAPFEKTPVLDDLRVIELYEDMMQSKVPVEQRHGYWVQTYRTLTDILRYIDTNLKDIEAVRKLSE